MDKTGLVVVWLFLFFCCLGFFAWKLGDTLSNTGANDSQQMFTNFARNYETSILETHVLIFHLGFFSESQNQKKTCKYFSVMLRVH